ncbi:hypothetical protein NLG97_g3117 [Lecanicillium saksenae]|uniref:Uncharacterized protein n=1 Tax=Lecanicillium saksenae TaxID=468837 RepID=A0ACC1R1N6_9HYPO|nr:hypothetical protein NLG97_g3117 [Lecanicillium saksenae]
MFKAQIPATEKSPIQLDQNARELYERAITNPESITDAERRTIRNLPSAEVEDGLVRESSEARKRVRMIPEDRELWEKADKAVKSEQKLAAELVAGEAYRRWFRARGEARASLPPEEYKLLFVAMDVPWQKHLLQIRGNSKVGLVFFVLNQPEWPAFKAKIEQWIQTGLTVMCSKVHQLIRTRFALHWIQGDGSSAELPSKYCSLADLPPGVRSDCFLYVDDESLRSREAAKPFVWLHEPATTLSPLKVDIRHIFPALFARLTQRDMPAGPPFTTSPDFEGFHLAASRAESGDGIWPPFFVRI